MISALVFPAWVAAFLVFRTIFKDWREAILGASVIWGLILLALTEGLSVFHAFVFGPLVIAWAIISCASVSITFHLWQRGHVTPLRVTNPFQRKHLPTATLLVGISLVTLPTLVVALVSPPNSWDSMTYHMVRVAYWVDRHSVGCYPTHILRQLFLGPWSEFAIAHFQILVGSDRLANLVEYLSMLGASVGASLVAKKLGAGKLGQLFTGIYCLTIPAVVLEASSTLNDVVTAFGVLCVINFTMNLIDSMNSRPWLEVVMIGASVGLAVLTKMTALIFAAPFLLWLSIVLLRHKRMLAIPLLAAVGAVALTINVGHLLRNEFTFGSPLGPPAATAALKNEIHTPGAVVSNIVRNLAVHMALPKVGRQIRNGILEILSLTGLDPADPRITFQSRKFEYYLSFDEFFAGNPFHLFLAVLGILIVLWKFPENPRPAVYAICVCAGFLLFCGYLRWQPWVSRLQSPLFVAIGPVFGVAFGRPPFRQAGYIFSSIAICVGVIYATANDTRPLLGENTIFARSRLDLYFSSKPRLRDPYLAAALEVARGRPGIIGIITLDEGWEYPFWVLVREQSGILPHFVHVNVSNASQNCASLSTSAGSLPNKIVVIGTDGVVHLPANYELRMSSDEIRLFEKGP